MNNTTYQKVPVRVGIDLDGVLYDFHSEFRDFVAQSRGISPEYLAPPARWNFFEDWGMTIDDYYQVLAHAAVRGKLFASGNVLDGAVEGMRALDDLGYEVVIISARDLTTSSEQLEFIREYTEKWLTDQGIPYSELILDHDKTRHDVKILLDDGLHNVEAGLMSDIMTFVFDQPWNQYGLFPRVNGWTEFVEEMRSIRENIQSVMDGTSGMQAQATA